MIINTQPLLKVLLLSLLFIFHCSCAKDTDLLADYVLADASDSTETTTTTINFDINNDYDTVENISALLALDPIAGQRINVLGYYKPNDGGGGIFQYDETRSDTNDGGTLIDGWVRQYNGAINIKWFGAKGDGNNDDINSIQHALTALQDNDSLHFPFGDYIVGSRITMSNKTNVTLISDGASIISIDVNYPKIRYGKPLLYVDDCIGSKIVGLKWIGTATKGSNEVSAIFIEDSINMLIEENEVWGMSGVAQIAEADCDKNTYNSNVVRDSRIGSECRGIWLGNGNPGDFTKNITVTNNKVYNNDHTGIVMFSEGGLAINNYCYDNLGSGLITGGYIGAQVKDIVIKENHLQGNRWYGYQHDSYAGIGEYITNNISIINNSCIGNLTGGILLHSAENTIVSGNLVKNNVGCGIDIPQFITNAIVHNNIILDDQIAPTQVDGIQIVVQGDRFNKNITISENVIDGNSKYGIELITVALGDSITGVHIQNNNIKNNSYGLYSANNGSFKSVQIKNNVFIDNKIRDVRLTGVKNSTFIEFMNNTWDGDRTQFDLF